MPRTIRALVRDRSPPITPTTTRSISEIRYGSDSVGSFRLPTPHLPQRTVWTTSETIDQMVKATSGPPIPTDAELAEQAAALLEPTK